MSKRDRSVLEPARRVKLTCAVDLGVARGRLALGRPRAARDAHDVRGRPEIRQEPRHAGHGRRRIAGRPLPMSDLPNRPGSMILMSAEDDPNRTIVPRLEAAGADLTKVHLLESMVLANGFETLPSLRADVDAITAAAARLGDCRLIVIDPVSAYLEGIDDNRNADLRGVLTPLKTLAENLRAAVVLVSHLTKAGLGQRKAPCHGLGRLHRRVPRQPFVRRRSPRPERPARPDGR